MLLGTQLLMQEANWYKDKYFGWKLETRSYISKYRFFCVTQKSRLSFKLHWLLVTKLWRKAFSCRLGIFKVGWGWNWRIYTTLEIPGQDWLMSISHTCLYCCSCAQKSLLSKSYLSFGFLQSIWFMMLLPWFCWRILNLKLRMF